ncbi:MAG: T9SS type A sorting domain-containing protein [Bacteroidia bacterium]|nr:T9SS type A sorting domain-containing protein [Bacteroidia bacterium]|tara:strand:- start:1190 stop:3472 length:2283 start_codon:yes stop_codon:yes gene_type:complete
MRKLAFVSIILIYSLKMSAQLFEISFDPIFKSQSGELISLALTGGMNQPQFSNIDFNNDGKLDLFAFDRNGNRVLTFIAKSTHGKISYDYDPKYEELFPSAQEFMQLHDYNGDSKPDLWLYTGDSVVLYQNNGQTTPSFDKIKGLFAFDRVNYVPFNPFKKLAEIKGCLPAIVDVDGDSDIDFVTNLNVTGSQMIFNRNTTADSSFQLGNIKFDIVDKCYGGIDEYNGELIVNAPCYFYEAYKQKKKHTATKTILLFDEDADGDLDLLFGSSERATNPIYFFRNGKVDLDYYKDTFITIDTAYFNNEIESLLPVSPALSYVDVNLDGVKDLILSTNEVDKTSYPIMEANNSILLINEGLSNDVDFVYEQNDFLVGDMIDYGSGCSPTFVDLDADGDQDLIFGTSGNHFLTGDTSDFLVYFKNEGSPEFADFQLVSDDFLNLKSKHIKGIMPTFADIDGDGDMDLFLGKMDGSISYYENSGDAENPAFTPITSLYEDIQVVNYAAPYFDDINKDGILDLLVGSYDGTIDYYQNTGSSSEPNFNLTKDTFGGIIVNELIRTSKLGSDGQIYDTMVYQNYGYSTPVILHWENDSRCIAVGNNQGVIKIYELNNDLNSDFIEIEDYMIESLSQNSYVKDWGKRTNPSATDLDGDGCPDMLIGNDRGGMSFVKGNKKTNSIQGLEKLSSFKVIPNPAKHYFRIETKTNKQIHYRITDVSGRLIREDSTFSGNSIQMENFPDGIYFVSIEDGLRNYQVQKLILLKL